MNPDDLTDEQPDELEIHFGHTDTSIPRLLCEACGEPVRITGEQSLRGFEPVGCDCEEPFTYRLEHVDNGESTDD